MNERAKRLRFLPTVVLGVLLIAFGAGFIWLVRGWLGQPVQSHKKVVQEVRLIRPPPTPPEPPPPPPPEEEVDVPEPEIEPEPTPTDDPPPGEQLGLDADGAAGGDGFGLVGRKGGRDLLAGGNSAFMWYSGLVKDEFLQALQDEAEARAGSYSIRVRVWVRVDGSVERVQLTQSSGNTVRDRAIESALARVARLSKSPPADMPQPINLRIVSRA
ncbi:MAG TPA: TonB family protein [Steroidobacteraceae bacterium]|nr:TonB family protein [Steroidobacteraceae bacterium]